MQADFRRVAIVNRGDAAMRFIHAVREFNHENGTSIRTIALYTEPDCYSSFVREADESVLLGPAQFEDRVTHHLRSTYLDYERLENALTSVRADAVWVGWGFVAEHAQFADLCRELEIVFIGPSGDVMRRLGDKITSKQFAETAGIPVVPWSRGAVETVGDARHYAEQLGYPLLIKATAGVGGYGIRRVDSASDLSEAFESTRDEAFRAFGNPTVFMEQLLQGVRQVEVQIVADLYGTTWAAAVSDSTIRSPQEKVLEESPSPVLSLEEEQEVRKFAVQLSKEAGYLSAGTVEFLYQPASRRFSFIEMNPRLQMEHSVIECVSGIDLMKLQIHIARGGRLAPEPPDVRGHAIEVRLNAERLNPGSERTQQVVEYLRLTSGPGLRIDTAVAEGELLPTDFEPAIASIVAYGETRAEAFARMQRVLRDSVVTVSGGTSNKSFLLDLVSRPEVRNGTADVDSLDSFLASRKQLPDYADVAIVAAAIEVYEAELKTERTEFYIAAGRGRPQVRSEIGRTVSLRYRGNLYTSRVCRLGACLYRVEAEGACTEVQIERVGTHEYWLTSPEKRFHIVSSNRELEYFLEVNGVAHSIQRDDGGFVRATAPAVVVSIAVQAGDPVCVSDRLVVLEAMKMEMDITAPFAGRVRRIFCIPNVQVDPGTPLLQIDPSTPEPGIEGTERVILGSSLKPDKTNCVPLSRCRQGLRDLRQLMLGFDLEPKDTAKLMNDWIRSCPAENESLRKEEDEILGIFADVCLLFQHEPQLDDVVGGEAPSSETYLFSYLRNVESDGEGLPTIFAESLLRALAHYGIKSLEHTPRLDEALLWIYKSHQRASKVAPLISDLLDRRLRNVEISAPCADEYLRTLLERISSITLESFPAVSDLAREVRYRYFEHVQFEETRRRVYAEMEGHLAHLEANPKSADHRERMRALVDCPQPMVSLFAGRFSSTSRELRLSMLEVLALRYYRIRQLTNLSCSEHEGTSYASAEYEHEDKNIHLFATYADYDRIPEVLQALSPSISAVPADHDVVVDCYVWHAGLLKQPDVTEQEVRSILQKVTFSRSIRRIVVAIGSPGREQGMGGMQHFTYRPSVGGYEEEKLYRGLHPMMGKRLHLWRLTNFNIERLPSVEDVYLLRGIAKNNPKDERLFACAEVRDLTPVRDLSGSIVQLPQLERQFTEALAAIRLFQSRRKPNERLYWNRILLYVWPPFNLTPDELNTIVHRLAPSTEGLGLEQVAIRARIPNPETGELRDMVVRISSSGGSGFLITFRPAGPLQPLKPLSPYEQKVVRMRQRGLVYPFEIVKMLTPAPDDTRSDFPPGSFVEHDFDLEGKLVPVDRPYGENKANIIVGLIRNFTPNCPEGMLRVALMGDPCKDLGALAEPECRRIIAGIDKASELGVPLEWYALSAGAKISMESGVENMDWIARVLRRLVEFTQAGGEVNLIINGINVGAQPYWNAEATMLMHTRGILIMTPKAAMVLTGKRALDYSGGVSAEDNLGIGGYERIMGLNGQAQYWAQDIDDACRILMRHYEHTYVMPGERFPRPLPTADPVERDVCLHPHNGTHATAFKLVGEIFSDETNRGRKKSFDIRKVMMAVIDQDHPPLERWAGMRAAESSVVWDAHLGGIPVCLIGIESHPVPRLGFVPADGPDQWTSGTLFPLSSKKVARAINAASNNRPVVVLANLSGFDGSPESMRKLQLEYGAEIGRAVVNFKGPMIFCVISRYHGGAYVVFSRALNENLEVLALEGTYASVIGGAPAAAVVFANEVEARAKKDPRLQELTEAIARANNVEKARLRAQWDELFKIVHSEKLGEVADEFDHIHSVHRALSVGALNQIIPPANLRPYLIHAVEHATGIVSERTTSQDKAKREEEVAA
jgi:acetyl/propionyl-CoA carboxylase alpha subunit/acetyl-CoA carboxylase carboxyltransferase component